MARSRIPLYTPEHAAILEKVVASLRAGNHRAVACEAAGISYSTLKLYIDIAEGKRTNWLPPPDYLPTIQKFAADVKRAEAEAEREIVEKIHDRAKVDAELGLKFLARRYPHRWGDRSQSVNINIDWRSEAVRMLREGEVTWEHLLEEIGKDLLEKEVRPLLKPGEVVEGEFAELPQANDNREPTERRVVGEVGEGEIKSKDQTKPVARQTPRRRQRKASPIS